MANNVHPSLLGLYAVVHRAAGLVGTDKLEEYRRHVVEGCQQCGKKAAWLIYLEDNSVPNYPPSEFVGNLNHVLNPGTTPLWEEDHLIPAS